jgi:hypothetical protein
VALTWGQPAQASFSPGFVWMSSLVWLLACLDVITCMVAGLSGCHHLLDFLNSFWFCLIIILLPIF